MSDEPIVAAEVVDTQYGEKVLLRSPFDAKDFVKVLPYFDVQSELEEHGSLRRKATSRGMSEDNIAIVAVEDYMDEHGFADDFAAHPSWESDAFGIDDGAWTIDADALEEAFEFFEFAGFETKNQTNL